MADEKYLCHILKPLENIDIPGIAGVLRYFLLFIFLAYPGIKWHSFDPKSSKSGSKSKGLISFYHPPLATRFSSSCASIKEFAYIKNHHPELWLELYQLSLTENLASPAFKYSKTFFEVD